MHVYSSTVDDTSKEFCHFSNELGIHFILGVSYDVSRHATIKTVHILGPISFKSFSSGLPIHLSHIPTNTDPSINTCSMFGKIQNHWG